MAVASLPRAPATGTDNVQCLPFWCVLAMAPGGNVAEGLALGAADAEALGTADALVAGLAPGAGLVLAAGLLDTAELAPADALGAADTVGIGVGGGSRSARFVRMVNWLAVSWLTSVSLRSCCARMSLTSSMVALGFLNSNCQTVPPV